jgi:hypothetical protein
VALKSLTWLNHPFRHLCIVFIFQWTCSRPEYSWNTARWMLSSNQSKHGIKKAFNQSTIQKKLQHKIILYISYNLSEGMVQSGQWLECHWKSMDSSVGMKNLVFCTGYSFFLNLQKEDFRMQWHKESIQPIDHTKEVTT